MLSRIRNTIAEYKELRYLAYHDSLTGLLNRNWLYKNIDQIKAKYVYFIDINDLHSVNENGHIFGDEYIKKAVSMINHRGTLIRYAGDEFILFSDFKNEVETNSVFAVGCSFVSKSIIESIYDADTCMLNEKRNLKSNKF